MDGRLTIHHPFDGAANVLAGRETRSLVWIRPRRADVLCTIPHAPAPDSTLDTQAPEVKQGTKSRCHTLTVRACGHNKARHKASAAAGRQRGRRESQRRRRNHQPL